jgi:hypothetical protein
MIVHLFGTPSKKSPPSKPNKLKLAPNLQVALTMRRKKIKVTLPKAIEKRDSAI